MKKSLLLLVSALISGVAFSQVLVDESFDGTSLPDGWTKTSNNSIGWVFGSTAGLSSQYWAIPSHDGNCAASNDDANDNNSATHDASVDYLITPSFDLSSADAALLSFDIFNNGQWGSSAFIRVSTDGGENFSQILAVPEEGEWQTISLSLGDYLGESDVQVAFHHNDNGLWAGGVAVDNVKISIPAENDAAMTALTTALYMENNSSVTVEGVISNMGSAAITSVSIDWSTSDGQTGSTTIDGLNVSTLATYNFSHPNTVSVGSEPLELTVEITGVNGTDDGNAADNSLTMTLSPLLFVPNRKVVLEQGTGTWCGWCPRGHVNAEFMDETYENSINIAVHNSDPMANSTYDSGMGAQIGGYPSGLVDRFFNDIDPSSFEELYLQRIAMQAIASVDATTSFDSESRELSINVDATFAISGSGNYRLNAIIVEDNVTGTGSGYNQRNFYSGGGAGPMGGYELLPDPVPASQMVYHNVGRRILGGWNGTVNSVPGTVVAGDVYSQDYSFTLPASWDEDEVFVVALIIDNATGEIVNAERSSGIVSASSVTSNDFDFNIFPNPTNDISNVLLSLERPGVVRYDVFDISGKRVISESKGQLAPGEYLHSIDVSELNSGMYFVSISIGENQITKKLSVY